MNNAGSVKNHNPLIIPASQTFNSALAIRISFSYQSFSLLLLCFFITFFFPSALAPHHERLTLYTTTINAG
jgi:hypothetical protein